MKAVITAGGRIDGAFAEAAGTRVKALAPVHGRTMLARMIESLRAAGASRIAVVGGEEVRAASASQIDRFVDESAAGSENLLRALRAWPDDGEPLLYATSDLPYVTPEAILAFTARVPPTALAVALAEFSDFARRFPGAPPFGITLAGERVVNGGVFALPSGSTEPLAAIAARFFDARKHPWQMASLVSPLVLLRFVLRRLSVADLEALAVRVLHMPARAVRGCAPELAYDVDLPSEYAYACAQR
ncbi:MAG: NTP transferase domain-containing protein [Candidatus Eremiobacteraeota bacterium]|nr:NTP transferase domain-containing protein [Candidatus Eremiobacteraeota bacterium]